MNTLFYIHGFNSSPQSGKAVALGAWLAMQHPETRYVVPALSPYPALAMQALTQEVGECVARGERVALLGSSLGGFYARWLAEKFSLRAIMVNPSLRPFDSMHAYLGENTNFHTAEKYVFTEQHVQDLASYYVPQISQPKDFFLMVQTGDEVIDYREAATGYAASPCLIEQGGDHGFQQFERWFAVIHAFAFH